MYSIESIQSVNLPKHTDWSLIQVRSQSDKMGKKGTNKKKKLDLLVRNDSNVFDEEKSINIST